MCCSRVFSSSKGNYVSKEEIELFLTEFQFGFLKTHFILERVILALTEMHCSSVQFLHLAALHVNLTELTAV